MNQQPKISIIVPVYGVEQYIAKCLSSIKNQTFTNFECLIIDDGSPDKSIPIAKELVGNDPRFIFLEKENGGLSSARNMGLDHATGDYIVFLDSDDYIDKETFEKCTIPIKNDPSIDVIIFGINWVTPSGKLIKKTISDVKKYYNKKDFLLIENSIDVIVCNKIYKKDIFNSLRFTEDIIHEDNDFTYRSIYQKKLHLINEYLYFYVQREGSITKVYNKNLYRSLTVIYSGYEKFYREYLISQNIKKSYLDKAYITILFISPLLQIARYSINYKKDVKFLLSKLDRKKTSFLKVLTLYITTQPKSFLGITLFKISPSLFKKSFNFFDKKTN